MVFLLFQLGKVNIVEIICHWYHAVIKPLVSGLIATDQQYRHTARIEGIKHSEWFTATLNPQFPHVIMPGTGYPARIGEGQIGTALFQLADVGGYTDLFIFDERIPPVTEFAGVFD
jgi:hypothetical protein